MTNVDDINLGNWVKWSSLMKKNSRYKTIRLKRLPASSRLYSTLLLIVIGSCLSADTLKIELKFTKLPPRTGIVYFPENNSLPRSNQVVIDQVNKKFTKILSVGTQGSMVVFKNSDSVDHNIYANDIGANVFFDVGLAEPGEESTIRMDWDTSTIIRIGCKIHPRMKCYIANIPSTHYKIFRFRRDKTRYRVKMKNIPAPLTQVKMWFPSYADVRANVAIGETKVIPLLKRRKRYGTVKLIRESEKVFPEPKETTHLSEKHVPNSEETVRKSQKFVPDSEKWFPASKETTHRTKKRVPNSEDTAREPEKFIPESEKWFPASKEATHLSGVRVSNSEETVDTSKRLISESNRLIRESEKLILESEKWFPTSKEGSHRSETLFPKQEESVPDTRKRVPESEAPTFESDQWSPLLDKAVSKSKKRLKE